MLAPAGDGKGIALHAVASVALQNTVYIVTMYVFTMCPARACPHHEKLRHTTCS